MRPFLGTISLLIVCFVSCRKFDENAPVIGSVKINETTGEDLTASAGSANIFGFNLTDDENLKQLRLELNTLTGVHAHESGQGEDAHPFLFINQGSLDTLIVANVSGSEANKELLIQISDTTAGGWEMDVDVLDEAGNLKSESFEFQIFNPFIPQITFGNLSPQPTTDGRFDIAVNQSLMFDIGVFANETLSEVVYNVVKGSSSASNAIALTSNTYIASGVTLTDFTESGTYEVTISAETISGRRAEFYATVVAQ